MDEEQKFCECGCGEVVKPGRRFVQSHHHRCRSEETRKLFSEVRKGKKANLSEEGRRKLSEQCKARVGEKHPMFGKKHSEETKRKYSEDRKGKKRPESVSRFISERNLRWWSDPEYREKMTQFLDMMHQNNFGRKHSQESKDKMSASHSGEKHFFFGKKHKEETKLKMSLSKIGKYDGDKNPMWNGGSSLQKYPSIWVNREFKKSLKERDGFKCQNPDCKENSKKITLHHIDYNKTNNEPNNLITLCHACNCRANVNRSYWQTFYTNIMTKIAPKI